MSSTRVQTPIRIYTHNLSERRIVTADVPYGCYRYESAKNYLPGGLFHFVKDAESYVPTLHGLSSDFIGTLKEVAVSSANSSIANRPFLNTPHLYEVELINTGHESLKQGDRFAVQIPNPEEVAAQLEVNVDLGYNMCVNKGIWGGLLATRKVNCESRGDTVEEVIHAIKHEQEFDTFQLISPYTPQCALSMLTLVANGAGHHNVPDVMRNNAALAVNEDFDAGIITAILQDENVIRFLRTVLRHSISIVESVHGFAAGQVVRACNSYTYSTINTGDRFMAQLNMNRWLS